MGIKNYPKNLYNVLLALDKHDKFSGQLADHWFREIVRNVYFLPPSVGTTRGQGIIRVVVVVATFF